MINKELVLELEIKKILTQAVITAKVEELQSLNKSIHSYTTSLQKLQLKALTEINNKVMFENISIQYHDKLIREFSSEHTILVDIINQLTFQHTELRSNVKAEYAEYVNNFKNNSK